MSPKLSDIGFRIFPTNDFLFGLFSQLPLLLWNGVVTREICFATFQCACAFEIFLALMRIFMIRILRCLVPLEMSNKIALVSLDFAGMGSVCGGNKGVIRHGRTFSRNNN
jgi:hypothetical protein